MCLNSIPTESNHAPIVETPHPTSLLIDQCGSGHTRRHSFDGAKYRNFISESVGSNPTVVIYSGGHMFTYHYHNPTKSLTLRLYNRTITTYLPINPDHPARASYDGLYWTAYYSPLTEDFCKRNAIQRPHTPWAGDVSYLFNHIDNATHHYGITRNSYYQTAITTLLRLLDHRYGANPTPTIEETINTLSQIDSFTMLIPSRGHHILTHTIHDPITVIPSSTLLCPNTPPTPTSTSA
jgi:hypothetical protein